MAQVGSHHKCLKSNPDATNGTANMAYMGLWDWWFLGLAFMQAMAQAQGGNLDGIFGPPLIEEPCLLTGFARQNQVDPNSWNGRTEG